MSETVRLGLADAYRGEMEHFVRVVRGEAELQPSGAAAVATVLARAAERFHREGKPSGSRETRDGEVSCEEAD